MRPQQRVCWGHTRVSDVYFHTQAEDKLALAAQIMNETAALLMEDCSGASWDEKQVEHLVNVLTQQADNLQACVSLSLILLIRVEKA